MRLLNERNIIITIAGMSLTYLIARIINIQLVMAFIGLLNTLFGVGSILYLTIFPGRKISIIELLVFSFGISISILPVITLLLHITTSTRITPLANILLVNGLIIIGMIIRAILSVKYKYRRIQV